VLVDLAQYVTLFCELHHHAQVVVLDVHKGLLVLNYVFMAKQEFTVRVNLTSLIFW
jgi:hypothetical protein